MSAGVHGIIVLLFYVLMFLYGASLRMSEFIVFNLKLCG